jgi:hypothetical protein
LAATPAARWHNSPGSSLSQVSSSAAFFAFSFLDYRIKQDRCAAIVLSHRLPNFFQFFKQGFHGASPLCCLVRLVRDLLDLGINVTNIVADLVDQIFATAFIEDAPARILRSGRTTARRDPSPCA